MESAADISGEATARKSAQSFFAVQRRWTTTSIHRAARARDVHPNLGDQKTARAQCRLLLQEHGAKLLAWWEGFTFQLEDFIELRLPERVEL